MVGFEQKGRVQNGIRFLRGSSGKVGDFPKTSTETLRGRPHTRRGKVQPRLVDTQRRGKAD